MTTKRTLVLLTKAPIPGFVKTRLVPPLTFYEAAELSRCFLLDILDMTRELHDVELCVAYTPPGAANLLPAPVLRAASRVFAQPDGAFGAKMQGVFETLFDDGAESVVMIHSDIPTVPSEYVAMAFDKLEDHPAALGPCRDGRYYLLGLRRLIPEVFTDIEWSSSRVSVQTRQRIKHVKLGMRFVPPWYDIDLPDDLDLLISQLAILQASRRGRLPRHTAHYLAQIGRRTEVTF